MSRPVWVLVVTLAATLAGCTGGDHTAVIGRAGSVPATTTPPTTTVDTPATPLAFSVSSFDVEGPGRPASVEAVRTAVVRAFDRYLEVGVLQPLRSGGPAGELLPLFTARAGRQLATNGDRRAFTDEGLPPAARIVAVASGLRLAGLAEPGGTLVLVSARMDLKLVAGVQDATITIDRGADLLLVAEGDDWKIDSYRVRVTRDTPDSSTTVVTGQ